MRRRLRDPFRWAVLVLLAVIAGSVLQLRAPADAAMAQAAAHGWHGAYDILVTTDKANVGIDGLLPPNELSDQTSGLLPAQLERVRKIPDVDVAAPLGYAQLVEASGLGFVTIPHDSGVAEKAKSAPTAYLMSVRFESDDGTGPRGIGTVDQTVVIGGNTGDGDGSSPTAYRDGGCMFDDVSITAAESKRYPQLFALLCPDVASPQARQSALAGSLGVVSLASELTTADGDVLVQLSGLPPASTRLTLVDPVAEQKLLGAAGSFLAPLTAMGIRSDIDAAQLSAWASGAADVAPQTSATISALAKQEQERNAAAQPTKALLAEARDFAAKHPSIADDLDQLVTVSTTYLPARYVPVLYSAPDPKVTATVSVKSVPVTADHATPMVLDARHSVSAAGEANPPGWTAASVSADGVADVFRPTTTLPWPGTGGVSTGLFDRPLPTLGTASSIAQPQYRVRAAVGTGAAFSAEVSPLAYVAQDADYTAGNLGSLSLQSAQAAPAAGSEAAYFELAGSASDVENAAVAPDQWLQLGGADASALAAASRAGGDAPLGAYGSVPTRVVEPDGSKVKLGASVFGLGIASSQTTAIASVYGSLAPGFEATVTAIRVRVANTDGYDAAGRLRVIGVAQAIDRIPGLHATIVVGSTQVPVKLTIGGYAFPTVTDGGAQKAGTLGTSTQQWTKLGAAASGGYAVPAGVWPLVWAVLAAVLVLAGSVELAGFGRGIRMPRRKAERAANPPVTPFGFGMRQLAAHGGHWLSVWLGAVALGGFGAVRCSAARTVALLPRSGVASSVVLVGVGAIAGVLLLVFGCLAALRGRRTVARALVASNWTPADRTIALVGELAVVLVIAVLVGLIAAGAVGGLTPWGVTGAVVD